jgi:hypothetical protein
MRAEDVVLGELEGVTERVICGRGTTRQWLDPSEAQRWRLKKSMMKRAARMMSSPQRSEGQR